ncbi:MAG: tannase/feruloyl esterase family alpha/beta hydrolase [Rhodoferax sp.]|nr:tannase/feruloyl esterase family alpha/beta hydrolase [Rhodoferax sp.]
MFAGLVNSKGEVLYSDWPGTLAARANRFWQLARGSCKAPIAGPIIGVLGGGSVAYTFSSHPSPVAGNPPALIKSHCSTDNFDTDAATLYATSGAFKESSVQFMTPPNAADLSKFKAKGGKLIVYHGTSDPVFSFNDTRNWYEALNRHHAGNAGSFARLFPVPGAELLPGGPPRSSSICSAPWSTG